MEEQLLRENRSTLITAFTFDMSWLAGEMNIIGLLSDGQLEDVTKVKSLLSDQQKSEILFTSLKRKVDLDPKHLYAFIDILKGKRRMFKTALKILERKLSMKYR